MTDNTTGLQPTSYYKLQLDNTVTGGTAPLVATLTNAIINIEFLDANDNPFENTTGGVLTIFGKYNNGKSIPLGALDLSSTYQLQINGKYTKLIFSLSSLTGASAIIINVDQNENMVLLSEGGGATGSGAKILVVDSPDGSIKQIGASVYNNQTQTLLIELEASGSGTGTVKSVSATGTNHITAQVTGDPNVNPQVEVTSDATSANDPSKIVARDANGNFSAGTITANLDGNATSADTAGHATTADSATSADTAGHATTADSATNADNANHATTADSATNFLGQLGGDVSGTQSATVVNKVGGKTSTEIANTVTEVAGATSTPIANALPLYDANGNLVANDFIGNTGGTQVTNPKTQALSTLNQALADVYSSASGGILIANTVYVAKNGDDTTGDGTLNKPYLTIQKAIDSSPANTQIWVFASGLSGANSTYAENITLKASQVITGSSSQFVVIDGSVTTPATGGTCYIENLRIQPSSARGNINSINFVGTNNVTNLQLSNVDVNVWGGTGHCCSWTNTNANSKLIIDGICAWNVTNSSLGSTLFTSNTGTAGTVIATYLSAQIIDSTNKTAYNLQGAIKFYHTFDNIYGQVRVANTAAFFGTFLTINTNNIAAMVTNSTAVSTINSCVMTTTANALTGTAVVEGAGGFAFYGTATPNTTVKGFATTLNGGAGAICAPTYSLRLDSSAFAPFTAGYSDGLIQYDGNVFYVDTLTARYKLPTADSTTGKILATWLNINNSPTFATKATDDMVSSAGFYTALKNACGSGISWDNVNGTFSSSGGGSGGSYANLQDFLAGGIFAQAAGQVNLFTANVKAVSGCTVDFSGNVSLLANRTYKFNLMMPVKTSGTPTLSSFTLQYTGATTAPPLYAMSTANVNITNGSIANNIFTASANVGTVTAKDYTIAGALMNYTPKISFSPFLSNIGSASTTANTWVFYTRNSLLANSPVIYDNGSALLSYTPTSLAKSGGVGLGTTNWIAFTCPIVPSGTYVSAWSWSNDAYTVMFANNTQQNSVWFSADQGLNFTATPAQSSPNIQPSRNNTALFKDKFITINTDKTGCYYVLSTNTKTNFTVANVTDAQVGWSCVASGYTNSPSGGTFVAVGNADLVGGGQWDYIKYTSVNIMSWSSMTTNIKLIAPSANYFASICYNSINQRWYGIVWDYANNNTYIIRATQPNNLSDWALLQTLNGTLYTNLVFQKMCGVGVTNSSFAMVATKYSKSGVENNVTICSTDGNVFNTITNDYNTIANVLPVVHPSGTIILTTSNTSNEYRYTYDGITWATATANSNCQGYFCPVGNGFARINAAYSWQQIYAAYRNTISNATPNLIPTRIYSGGQIMTGGVGIPATIPIALYADDANVTGGLIASGGQIGVGGDNFSTNFSIGMTNLYNMERVTSMAADMQVLQNGIQFYAQASGGTLTSSPQYSLTQNDRIPLTGTIITGASAVNLGIYFGYAQGQVQVLSTPTFEITEI